MYRLRFEVVGDWAYYVVLIDLPKYMHDVLHVSVKENGVLTALPWAMYMTVCFTSGYVSDMLTSSGRISVTTARKVMLSLGEHLF